MGGVGGPQPQAGMTRTVPGWRWLEGKESQDREWAALMDDFYRYIRLNTWELATIEKITRFNEQDRTVHLEVRMTVRGKIVPGSFHVGVAP